MFHVTIFFADEIFLFPPYILGRNLRKISRITRSHPQPIFSLPREFQEKNKNTEKEIKSTLADLGINLEIPYRWDSENWYTASSSLWGLTLTFRMVNHSLHPLQYSSTYYHYFHTLPIPSKDLLRHCVLFFTTYTLLPSSFSPSVCAYLVFGT